MKTTLLLALLWLAVGCKKETQPITAMHTGIIDACTCPVFDYVPIGDYGAGVNFIDDKNNKQ